MERCKQCNSLMQIGDSKCRDCGYEENHPRFATLDLDSHDAFAADEPADSAPSVPNENPKVAYDATILPASITSENPVSSQDNAVANSESVARQNEPSDREEGALNGGGTGTGSEYAAADNSIPPVHSDQMLGGTLEIDSPAGPDTAFSVGRADTPKIRQPERPVSTGAQPPITPTEVAEVWSDLPDSKDHPERTIQGDLSLASEEIFQNIASRTVKGNLKPDESKDWKAPAFIIGSKLAEKLGSATGGHSDYELTDVLGMGGMGMVFEAQQEAIGREVAIKVIHDSQQPGSSSTQVRQKRFLYEAQITGALDHPNVVPIYDLGISNGILFYVMKNIEGTEWKKTIRQSGLDENLDIWEKVADAVALAHAKKILHRDLKPENVMLGKFGEVYVTDWGCAVDLNRKEPLSPAGSPPWMAPEMATQATNNIGPTSDVYLMGAILYQMLVGHPPHPGGTVRDCLNAARDNVIIEIDEEDPLLDIAFKAMATRPEDRYSDIRAMQADVKLYRKHAESISLCDRSTTSLSTGIANQDYEAFSRAIFGFQDAIRLWRGNHAAHDSLKQARLAYSQCAFDRGDFDLCLATLDPSISAEKELMHKAEKAQAKAAERESRMQRLKWTFASVVCVALLGMLGLTIAASVAQKKAKLNAEKADKNAADAKESKEDATRQQRLAEKRAAEAKESKENAIEQQRLAEERAATVELSNYHSKLALCLEQLRRNDIASGLSSYESLLNREQYPTLLNEGTLPRLRNWGTNRIRVLSNQEAIVPLFNGQLLKASHSPSTQRLAAAFQTEEGKVQVATAKIDRNRAILESQCTLSGDFLDLALGLAGEQLVYSIKPVAEDFSGKSPSLFLSRFSNPEKVLPIEGANFLPRIEMNRNWLVGGINSGLWIWRLQGEDWHQQEPTRIKNIRGRLIDAQFATEDCLLLLVGLDTNIFLHVVDLPNSVSRRVELSGVTKSVFSIADITAIGYSKGKILFGLGNGKVFFTSLNLNDGQVRDGFRELMPQKHSSAIQSIAVAEDGSLILRTNSPVGSLWKKSSSSQGWNEFSSLTGTRNNVAWVGFLDNQKQVLGLSQDGRSIVWDVHYQKQLWRGVPVTKDREALSLSDSVNSVAFSDASDRATLVLNDSSLVSLDLRTGQVLSPISEFHHVGHKPDAELIDFAVSPRAQILVSVAKIRESFGANDPWEPESDSVPASWEYCKWSLKSASMLDRWVLHDKTQQEISLAHEGGMILYASDAHTLFGSPSSTMRQQFLNREFGSFFCVPNPKDPFRLMLVKRSGAARMLDTRDPQESWNRAGFTIDYEDPKNSGLLSDDDRPICGAWAPEGTHFYMFWTSGRITEFVSDNETLSIARDLSASELLKLTSTSGISSFPRLQSKQQVDLKVRTVEDVNHVFIHLRYPTSEGKLRLLRISFPRDSKAAPSVLADDGRSATRFVFLNDARLPKPTQEPASRISLPKASIVASSSIDQLSYLATRNGTVYEVSENGTRAFGRPELIESDSSVDGNQVLTLHAGGVLWVGTIQPELDWNWRQLPQASENSDAIAMSNDGEALLIRSFEDEQPIVRRISISNGEELQVHRNAYSFEWDPRNATQYATIDMDGHVQLHTPEGERKIGQLAVDRVARQLRFFEETWDAEDKPNTRWLLVHTENKEGMDHRLEYYPLISANLTPVDPMQLGESSAIVDCETAGGVFAVGGQGTLAFYWATPTHGLSGAEMFSLNDHAGSKLVTLAFSPDGGFAVSADEEKRCFIWKAAKSTR